MMPGTYAGYDVVCVIWHHTGSLLHFARTCKLHFYLCLCLCVCVFACDCLYATVCAHSPFPVYIKSNIASHFNNVNGVVNKINGTRRQANFSPMHFEMSLESVYFDVQAMDEAGELCRHSWVCLCVRVSHSVLPLVPSPIDYRLFQMMHKSHLIWPVQRITSVPPSLPACRNTTNDCTRNY